MTDVVLIKPDFHDIAVMPPLGLGYLASVLLARGVSVQVHDNTLRLYDDIKLAEIIKEANPRVLGITAATPMIKRALEIAALAKKTNPGVLTVLGGPHPTCTASDTLASPDADVVVMGEGEETFLQIVERFFDGSRDFSGIKGAPAARFLSTPQGR
jgi:anaerobic magnesium-protoporphyrin IX monomethyl ester cyclase